MSAGSAAVIEDSILVERDGALGRITLNRPKAINALTLEMVRLIETALDSFESDDAIKVVLFDGAGERGFCAGGDIVALYEAAKAGDPTGPRAFWSEEYHLNARIGKFPKPIVAIMDGIVMGGGVGLAGHASHRVATERLKIAMPEVGIGFGPDVGGTYLLSRSPGELGTHLALTGQIAGTGDAIAAGLADYHVAIDDLPEFVQQLTGGDVESALAVVKQDAPAGTIAAGAEWINAAYAADSVEDVLANLRARPEEAAQKAADTVESKSPTSVKVTLESLRRARELPSLEACLAQEWRVSLAFLTAPDFVEGIRAAVVDKDRQPKWDPPTPDLVDSATVERFFAPLDGVAELEL